MTEISDQVKERLYSAKYTLIYPQGEGVFPKIADGRSASDVSGCVICNQQKTVPR